MPTSPPPPPPVARAIKLKKFAVTNVNYTYLSAFRLRVEVEVSHGIEPQIFVYRRDLANPYTGDVLDTFFTIASPVDMEEYPPEEPDPQKAYPFFRKRFVELDFRSSKLAEEAWLLIVEETQTLIHAMNRLEALELVEEVWIGPYPEDPATSHSEPEPFPES
jgi:hypothetical protein